jgi:hypothetical protein
MSTRDGQGNGGSGFPCARPAGCTRSSMRALPDTGSHFVPAAVAPIALCSLRTAGSYMSTHNGPYQKVWGTSSKPPSDRYAAMSPFAWCSPIPVTGTTWKSHKASALHPPACSTRPTPWVPGAVKECITVGPSALVPPRSHAREQGPAGRTWQVTSPTAPVGPSTSAWGGYGHAVALAPGIAHIAGGEGIAVIARVAGLGVATRHGCAVGASTRQGGGVPFVSWPFTSMHRSGLLGPVSCSYTTRTIAPGQRKGIPAIQDRGQGAVRGPAGWDREVLRPRTRSE